MSDDYKYSEIRNDNYENILKVLNEEIRVLTFDRDKYKQAFLSSREENGKLNKKNGRLKENIEHIKKQVKNITSQVMYLLDTALIS